MAASNEFKIIITGEDQISGKLKNVELQFSNLTRPIKNIGDGIKTISRENYLTGLLNGFTGLTNTTNELARGLESVLPPMAELIGLGSVGGIAAMAYQWGAVARQIALVSQQTEVSKKGIQEWIGAGEMAGVNADTMLSTISGFQQKIQSAVYGRDPHMWSLFQGIGIDVGVQGKGTRGVDDVLRQIVGKLRSGKIGKTELDQLGLGEVAPLLMQTNTAIDESIQKLHEYGYVQGDDAIQRGKAFQDSINETKVAIKGLSYSIGDELIPQFQPMVDGMNGWLKKNHAELAYDIGVGVHFLGGEVTALLAPVYEIGKAMGVWNDKAQALAIALTTISGVGIMKVLSKIPGANVAMAGGGYYELYQHSFFPEWFSQFQAWHMQKLMQTPDVPPLPVFYKEPFNYPRMQDQATPLGSPANTAIGPQSSNDNKEKSVNVTVDFKNTPAGMVASLVSSEQGKDAVKIAYALASFL